MINKTEIRAVFRQTLKMLHIIKFLWKKLVIGLVCLLLFLNSGVLFAVTTQFELQISPFPPPSNLTATVVSPTRIDLSWSSVSLAVSYKVYRDGSLIASPTTTFYSDTGLTPGATYSYTVSAVSIFGGESEQSHPVSATTPGLGLGGLGGIYLPSKVPPVVPEEEVIPPEEVIPLEEVIPPVEEVIPPEEEIVPSPLRPLFDILIEPVAKELRKWPVTSLLMAIGVIILIIVAYVIYRRRKKRNQLFLLI